MPVNSPHNSIIQFIAENGQKGPNKNFSQTCLEICSLSDLAINFLWTDLLGLQPHKSVEGKTESFGVETLRKCLDRLRSALYSISSLLELEEIFLQNVATKNNFKCWQSDIKVLPAAT